MSLMPSIDELEEVAVESSKDDELQPQTTLATLAQMRLVLGRCGAGLDAVPADAAGALLERVDRPLVGASGVPGAAVAAAER